MSAEWAALVGGVAGLAVSLLVNVTQIRARWRDSAKLQFSEALTDALNWVEFVYRIRRRKPGEESRIRIANEMHLAQVRLTHHLNWLRIESPGVHAAYKVLVDTVKSAAQEPLREGWETPAPSVDAQMNLGDDLHFEFATEADNYVDAVRRHLRRYLVKFWA